jgi:signal transduction histidine kinase
MGVQAGAARHVLKTKPEKAAESLSIIEASSRQTVNELYRLLGFLRSDQEVDQLAPQPSLSRLDSLVREVQQAGLAVDVKVQGDIANIPSSVDVSAYRIIQESLTNTLKHAGPARAKVIITRTEEAIDLLIDDDGKGKRSEESKKNRGRGLIGMRERVNLHGGEFSAEKLPGTGFRIKAKLPLKGRVP